MSNSITDEPEDMDDERVESSASSSSGAEVRGTRNSKSVSIHSHGSVSIHYERVYDDQYRTSTGLLPLQDYARLLHDISLIQAPSGGHYPQFTSRVGLARIALLAGGLGLLLGVHLVLLIVTFNFASPLTNWCIYAVAMCTYHWSEFLLTALHHPHTVSFDSFLVNQSKEFGIAIVVSWVEFAIELFWFPSLKQVNVVVFLGLVLVVVGQSLRSLSMYQAGPSFTHMIACEKAPRHVLISSGVYRYLRHPGYFGWFYWSLGTQLILCNPICLLAYFKVAQQFFRNRIPVEEEALLHIFGEEYRQYKAKTFIGIPGINV